MPTIPLGDHQLRALQEMMDREYLLVEYGTGTGKSRIIGLAAEIFVESGDIPGLILVPNSLVDQTYDQIVEWVGSKWAAKNITRLDRRLPVSHRRERLRYGNSNVYILSHESLSFAIVREGVKSRRWGFVMVDELSRFRNHSKRTTGLLNAGSRADVRYGFTGNLTVRNPSDSFYPMNFLKPGLFGTKNRETFNHSYFLLGGFSGNIPTDLRPDMHDQFFDIMNASRIQCELKDVRDLPERIMSIRTTQMSGDQQSAYDQMRHELRVEIERTNDADFASQVTTYATRLMRLQEIAAGFARNVDGDYVLFKSEKTEEVAQIILDDPATPTIVWYWFRPEVELIRNEFARQGIEYTEFQNKGGNTSVADFMSGKVNVFLCQNAKGGYGLNLTRAERMIYHTLPWDLDLYTQSQERNVRLNTPVPTKGFLEIVHMIVRDSAEEYVREKLVSKANMSRKFSRSQALEMLR